MSLKRKILTGYGVVFVLMALVIAWAVANLVSLGRATSAILSENYRSILAAENMVDALERQDSGVLLVYLGETESGIAQARENEALFLEWLARAKDNITIHGERELVQTIEADYETYLRLLSSVRGTDASAGPPGLPSSYRESVFPVFAKVREACITLRRLNEETMYGASVRAADVAGRAIWSTTLVAGVALTIALVFSLVLSERIVGPIRRYMTASRTISSGDYGVHVPVETQDEFGQLAEEFNRMAAQLGRYHEMNIEQIIEEKNKGEAVLSSIEDGLVVFDTDLRVTAVNPAARRLLSLDASDISALQCEDVLPDAQICKQIRATVRTGDQPDLPDEERVLTLSSDRQVRHFLYSVTPIRRKDRVLSGIVLLLRDITRIKEVERLKSEFIMAASHELRTPLTSLGMSVDLLLEHAARDLSEQDRELLQAAHEEVHRTKALVADLLDLSKIEAGKIDMDFEMVSIPDLFRRVHGVFKTQADMKSITLTTDASPGLPAVWADCQQDHLGDVEPDLQRPTVRQAGRPDRPRGQGGRPPRPPLGAR